MRTLSLIAACLLVVTGCALTKESTYGDFSGTDSETLSATMASGAAQQLVALYPPAKTRLTLNQPSTDRFGQALLASLRSAGYAIEEQHIPDPSARGIAEPAAALTAAMPASTLFNYVLDQVDHNLFRVTLLVGQQSLSRAYATAQDGKLYAAGYWVRGESGNGR